LIPDTENMLLFLECVTQTDIYEGTWDKLMKIGQKSYNSL